MGIAYGTIGFSRNDSFLSKAIRWFTRQEWSHTFIVLDRDTETGDYSTLEAGSRGVGMGSLAMYKSGYTVELFAIPSADPVAGLMAVNPLIGKRYGYLQLVWMIPVVLLRRIGVKMENPVTKGVICSELVIKYLAAACNEPEWLEDADETTPGDVYADVKAEPGIVKETW